MANQAKRGDRLKIADTVINNSGDLADLEQQVKKLHQKMLDL
jgi:dephospho-CoA kinase